MDEKEEESCEGTEFQDQYKNSIIITHSPLKMMVHIWVYISYHAPRCFEFTRSEARKIGKELIRLADDKEKSNDK